MTKNKKKEFLQLTNADSLIVSDYDSIVSPECIHFPLAELACLGSVFTSLQTAFSSMNFAGSGKVLYEATFPVAGELAKKDGAFLGAIIRKGEGVVGQARFHEVKDVAQGASQASMMFMALAIMAINKSIQNVAEMQKSILNFLEADKQSQLKGDLIVLSDILEEYAHNWNNSQYRNNREMQVLDIKRSSEQNILFYRDMIHKKFCKQAFIHLDTSKNLTDVQNKFRYYKLALYLYSYSSFLDIMLLENFDSAYLENTINKINKHASDYENLFVSSLESIEKYASSSLQARTLQGLAKAGKFAGEQIAKIPDKDNKIKIDEKLIASSGKIEKLHNDSIEKTLKQFTSVEDSGIKLFTEKIMLINHLHNNPLHIAFDEENIYLINSPVSAPKTN